MLHKILQNLVCFLKVFLSGNFIPIFKTSVRVEELTLTDTLNLKVTEVSLKENGASSECYLKVYVLEDVLKKSKVINFTLR